MTAISRGLRCARGAALKARREVSDDPPKEVKELMIMIQKPLESHSGTHQFRNGGGNHPALATDTRRLRPSRGAASKMFCLELAPLGKTNPRLSENSCPCRHQCHPGDTLRLRQPSQTCCLSPCANGHRDIATQQVVDNQHFQFFVVPLCNQRSHILVAEASGERQKVVRS